jgi:hypothetical protein
MIDHVMGYIIKVEAGYRSEEKLPVICELGENALDVNSEQAVLEAAEEVLTSVQFLAPWEVALDVKKLRAEYEVRGDQFLEQV